MHKKNKKREGFTLVELLVVIAIIGLLSTLSLVALNNARTKARDSMRVGNIKQWQTALELYYNDASGYPASSTPGDAIKIDDIVYMGIIPNNPKPWDDKGCSNLNFVYTSTDASTYQIQYCLAGASGGIPAGVHRATPLSITDP
jgi:prepilin-type N-terminal cleavage/methylation domain-containing protein